MILNIEVLPEAINQLPARIGFNQSFIRKGLFQFTEACAISIVNPKK